MVPYYCIHIVSLEPFVTFETVLCGSVSLLAHDLPNCINFLSVSVILLSSVQFSRSVMSDSLRPHERQHARPPCPSPTPEAYSNSRPLSQ